MGLREGYIKNTRNKKLLDKLNNLSIISTLDQGVLIARTDKNTRGGVVMKIQPLGDRVVVKPLEAESKTKGGIFIPDSAKEKPQEAEVIAVGKGKVLENGTLKALEVKVGDKILFGKYSGNEITTKDGEELLIMREEDILGIIK
jgi:chaperonin GroES